jgi:hypothetical protein
VFGLHVVVVFQKNLDMKCQRRFNVGLQGGKGNWMVYDTDEIARLLKEERSRGRKCSPPLSQEVLGKKIEQRQLVEKLLAERHLSRFKRRLIEVGLAVESEEYQIAVAAWLDHWRGPR